MDLNAAAQNAATILGVLVAGAGVVATIVVYVRARVKKQVDEDADRRAKEALNTLKITVDALKEQNDLQAGQIAEAKKAVSAQDAKIASLNGTVDTLKNIPLGKIEKHMAATNKILELLLPLVPNPTLTARTIVEATEITKKK